MSRLLCEGVTETVVPGQMRISPPRGSWTTAVSVPAVREDPAARRLAATATEPDPLVTGTIGAASVDRLAVVGACAGDFLLAFTSSGGVRWTRRRLPAPSQL